MGITHAARRLPVLLALLAVGCGQVVTLELPHVSLSEATPRVAPVPSVVVDAAGTQLAELRREYREPVALENIPRHLVDAVLTAEDGRFHDHAGVDLRSLARAALRNTATGQTEQGGSTITQQLVKQLYMPDAPRTPETKLREALLARELEAQRSKASILEEYLNTVYLGQGAYGVGAAAWSYFRTDVDDLDLARSALLAAIIRAPERLSPRERPQAVRQRRDDVLWRMAEAGHLTSAERDIAMQAPIEVHGPPAAPETREPHLVDLVVRTLLADPRFGVTRQDRADRLYGGGLRIHTTIDSEAQDLARAVLDEHLPGSDDPEAAIAALDPRTGRVVALVGNRSYGQLQFDLATQARRQPGSTFKSFALAAAIADGWHPQDRLDGNEGTITTPNGTWEVDNFERRSFGSVSLAGATRASVNAAYARLGLELGPGRIAHLTQAMGVRSPLPADDPQLTIGGGRVGVTVLDLAAAYGTIGNLGIHVPTTVIDRVEDADGDLVWLPDTTPTTALEPSAAFVTAQVLEDVVSRGTGRRAAVPGWRVAGKTGTTSDHADAWFAGTTPVLSAAVWVGHAEGRIPLRDVQGVGQVTGGSIPAEVFSTLLTRLLADTEPVDLELPEAATELVELDPRTGLRAAAWCPGVVERVPRVLVPTETCPQPAPPPRRPPPAPSVREADEAAGAADPDDDEPAAGDGAGDDADTEDVPGTDEGTATQDDGAEGPGTDEDTTTQDDPADDTDADGATGSGDAVIDDEGSSLPPA